MGWGLGCAVNPLSGVNVVLATRYGADNWRIARSNVAYSATVYVVAVGLLYLLRVHAALVGSVEINLAGTRGMEIHCEGSEKRWRLLCTSTCPADAAGETSQREPRAVSGRHPLGCVPVTLLRPVHRRIRDREVARGRSRCQRLQGAVEVRGEPDTVRGHDHGDFVQHHRSDERHTYIARVNAVNAQGTGAWSADATAVPGTPVPASRPVVAGALALLLLTVGTAAAMRRRSWVPLI